MANSYPPLVAWFLAGGLFNLIILVEVILLVTVGIALLTKAKTFRSAVVYMYCSSIPFFTGFAGWKFETWRLEAAIPSNPHITPSDLESIRTMCKIPFTMGVLGIVVTGVLALVLLHNKYRFREASHE